MPCPMRCVLSLTMSSSLHGCRKRLPLEARTPPQRQWRGSSRRGANHRACGPTFKRQSSKGGGCSPARRGVQTLVFTRPEEVFKQCSHTSYCEYDTCHSKFHDLWARMLVQFSESTRSCFDLSSIALLIPADTSECERIFSLMNDIKTSERESLGQEVLRNLMHWHIVGTSRARRWHSRTFRRWPFSRSGARWPPGPRGEAPTAPLIRQNSQPANQGGSREPQNV